MRPAAAGEDQTKKKCRIAAIQSKRRLKMGSWTSHPSHRRPRRESSRLRQFNPFRTSTMTNRLPRERGPSTNPPTRARSLYCLQYCNTACLILLPARLREEFVDIWCAYDAADERDDDPTLLPACDIACDTACNTATLRTDFPPPPPPPQRKWPYGKPGAAGPSSKLDVNKS